MIISKKLAGILGMASMVAVTLPITACGEDRVIKHASDANDVNGAHTQPVSPSGTAALARPVNEKAPSSADAEQMSRSSPAEARHFAVYARYRQFAGTSGNSTSLQDGDAKNASGNHPAATAAPACPHPRQID